MPLSPVARHKTPIFLFVVLVVATTVAAGDLPSAAATVAGDRSLIATVGSVFDPMDGRHPTARGDAGLVILQFEGSPTRRMKRSVEDLGMRLYHYIPNDAFLAVLPEDLSARTVSDLPDVRWIGDYLAAYKFDPTLLSGPVDAKEPVQVEVHLLPGANAIRVGDAVRSAVDPAVRVVAIHTKPHRTVLRLEVAGADLAAVVLAAAERPQVVSVARRLEPQLHNDHSVWVVQSYDTTNGPSEAVATQPRQYPMSATVWNHGLIGDGEIIAVADSGLNASCFFEYTSGAFPTPQELVPPAIGTIDPGQKVIAYYVQPGAAAHDHSACSYHGTHVSGSVGGDNRANLANEGPGTPNHDAGDGMAPAAQLVMQDVGASSGIDCSLSGLSGDFTDTLEQAYAAGARIHTNSWGSTTPTYTTDAADMDEMMWRREDIIFTVSMGNSGINPGDSTIGAPGTAKNIVSVGGVTNGSSTSSRADDMTTYSRGPTHDGRLKPDVVTPAYSINSANGGSSCGSTTLSGTSMAAPTTAGSVALLREYFVKGYARTGVATPADGRTPSGALMKAALTNGATPLGQVSGNDPLASGPVSVIPSMDQGWGRTYLEGSLYFAGDPARVRYWDVWHRDGIETGETVELHVDVPSDAGILAVTLAWADPPSATSAALNLVNNLDLEVESPARLVYLGNVFDSSGWSASGGTADSLNPIEGARVQAPTAGTWTIRVRGTGVPGTGLALNSDRQGFAVVASYPECASAPVAAPQNFAAVDDPPDGVALSWDPVAAATRYLVYKAMGSCPADPSHLTFLGETGTPSWADSRAYGGHTYAYQVAADDGCSISPLSACAEVTFTGPCDLQPTFEGAEAITNTSVSGQCALLLSWSAGSSNCPLGADLSYNVYRSTDPLFEPTANELLTTTTATSFEDLTVFGGVPYFYVVRAEDGTIGGPGPNGGNEEVNLLRLKGVPWTGTDVEVTDFSDDGGDSSAWMSTPYPWTITSQQNATVGGQYSYHSAVEGENYPAGTCSAVTTPPLELAAGYTHELRYKASYNIEVDWDGLVVEVSTDDGQTWLDLPPDSPVAGYPSDFSETGNPPINACGYSASQGAFNGPSGNGELTGWTEYISGLGSYDGSTVLIRWQFSTDPGSEFEGFYLDDIVVTNVHGPGLCANSYGTVELDSTVYSCSSTLRVSVADADLVGVGTTTVNLVTSTGDAETLTLTEDPADSGRLSGEISTSDGAAVGENGVLEVVHGGDLTVTYVDADDGQDGEDVPRVDTASVDCVSPTITDLSVGPVGATSATVTWQTADEPSDSMATASSGGASAADGALVTSHGVTIEGLSACRAYRVTVVSADLAGNQAAGGPTEQFLTNSLVTVVDDDVEGGTGVWTVDTVTDSPAGDEPDTPWAITDDPMAASPTHSWFSPDEDNVKDDRLVAGPFHLGAGTSILTFRHHFNFEGTSYDGGVLEVSSDGAVFVDVTEISPDDVFLEGEYTGVVSTTFSNPLGGKAAWTGDSGGLLTTTVDLSSQGGSDIWIRFRLGCDSSIADDGWYIDDIVLDTTSPCSADVFADGFESGNTSAWSVP